MGPNMFVNLVCLQMFVWWVSLGVGAGLRYMINLI